MSDEDVPPQRAADSSEAAARDGIERWTGVFRRSREAREAREAREDAAEAEEAAAAAKEAAAEARESAENFALRMLGQFERLREERQEQLAAPEPEQDHEPLPLKSPVPYGVELAAQWAWRFLVIVAAGYLITRALGFLALVVVPLVVALLIAALVEPIVGVLERIGLRRHLSALLVVIGVIVAVGALLSFAGTQVANGVSDLATQTSKGLGEVRDWLVSGPLHASDSQVDAWVATVQKTVEEWGSKQAANPVSRFSEIGGVALDAVASFFIVIFSTYFFCAEGSRIWTWVVRLTPRAARSRINSSGQVAWVSLTQFTRATVVVAAVDAVGIMIVASILRVPFIAAIGVLVFVGAFVPLIGATVAGTVAILVALVSQGPLTALLMLGGVILVQQLEAHGLQPFLLGRWVRVHPLGVILAVTTGIVLAGVAGGLVAVPLAAAVNAVVHHLTADSADPDDPDAPDGTVAGTTPEEA